MSMLKLNEALQLLTVKCWSIKLKQMINCSEKSTTILHYNYYFHYTLYVVISMINLDIKKLNKI